MVPFYGSVEEARAAAARQPDLVALQQTPRGQRAMPATYPAALPWPFERVADFGAGAEHLDAYVVAPAGRQP